MEKQEMALVPTNTNTHIERFSAFSSIENFEAVQRMAKILCSSSLVPQSYRDNIADCVIALDMANRIGVNNLAVMQNLYIVHGRPAWSSQFLISCVNASGKFSPLRYKQIGVKGEDSWGCVAWAVDKSGEKLESPEVTISIAKAEGWVSKNGSKWKTMPELMLRYRAATLFARLFAPELTMGIQMDDEIIDIAPIVTDSVSVAKQVFENPAAQIADAKPVLEMKQTDSKTATTAEAKPVTETASRNYAKTLSRLLKLEDVPESALVAILHAEKGVDPSLATLVDIERVSESALKWAHDNWSSGEGVLAKACSRRRAREGEGVG